MSRTLYLLVTAERPDTYLNSVVHCLLYEGVRTVEFIHIRDFGESTSVPEEIRGNKRSAKVWGWVHSLLHDLATAGEYHYFEGEKAGQRVDLQQFYSPEAFAAMREVYNQCFQFEVQWNHRDIPYSDLRKEIRGITAKKPSAIVDVSSIGKRFIGDLVAVSVLEGFDSLYTFDLVQRPDFEHPWATLFHDLKPSASTKAKYRYINLLDTHLFRECSRSLLVKRPPLYWSGAIGSVLLLGTVLAYWTSGVSSGFVQGMFIMSAVASLLSLLLVFFPLRK